MRGIPRRAWLVVSAAWAAIIGLLPHVLHHAGPLAGAALFAGVGGSLLFGVLGFVVAIPFLRQIHSRFGSWRAPAIAVALFAVVFSISSFVIAPAITGSEGGGNSSVAGSTARGQPAPSSHEAHHDD